MIKSFTHTRHYPGVRVNAGTDWEDILPGRDVTFDVSINLDKLVAQVGYRTSAKKPRTTLADGAIVITRLSAKDA